MTTEDGDVSAWECMEETAIIALGILMEETLRGALGETGYLALLEGDEEGTQAAPAKSREGSAIRFSWSGGDMDSASVLS